MKTERIVEKSQDATIKIESKTKASSQVSTTHLTGPFCFDDFMLIDLITSN